MNNRDALVGPLSIAGALLVCLGALWALVALDQTEHIVPAPEQVGESFFKDLAARDFGSARQQLAEDLRATTSASDLRTLADDVEQARQGLEDAHGLEAQEQAGIAQASVEVTLGDGQPTVGVPLSQENGLWKITSLDPLLKLTGQ